MANEQERRIYDRCLTRVGELEAENAKLRELVLDLYEGLNCPTEPDDGCPSCRFNSDDGCVFELRIQELGIEVDG